MVSEKEKKDRFARLLSLSEDYNMDDVPEPHSIEPTHNERSVPTNANGTNDIKNTHDDTHRSLPWDAGVSSPESIPDFIKAIRAIPSYSVREQKDGTFQVYKKGQELPVLTGDAKTCKMSSPLDQNILNAYVNANKGKDIIVDRCRTKEAAQALLDACKNSKPAANVKFPAGVLEKFGFDSWVCATHSLPPVSAAPDVEVMTKNPSMRSGKI